MDFLPQTFRNTEVKKKSGLGLFSTKVEAKLCDYFPASVFQADLTYWEKIERLVIYGGVMKSTDDSLKNINEQHLYTNYLQTYDPKTSVWECHVV